MPTPAGLNTTTLHGRFVEPDLEETPLQGSLTFTPNPSPVLFPDQNIIVAGTETVTLDVNGEFTVELVSTDVANGNPPLWTYSVVERLIGQRQRVYNISLNYNNGIVVELSDIMPTLDAPSYIPVIGPTGPPGLVTSVNGISLAHVVLDAADVGAVDLVEKGAANGVATLDLDGLVPIAQLPNLSSSYVAVSLIGAAEGVAELDLNAKVPASQLGLAAAAPPSVGVGSVGTSSLMAREDHTHDGVALAGDQTVAGLKTFTGGPVFTTTAPQFTGATAGADALRLNVAGEAADRLQVNSVGVMAWGDGVNAPATLLERLAEGVLQATSQVAVTGAAPTAENHLTRKDYVDELVSARTGVVTLDTSQVITGFKTLENALATGGVLQARGAGDAASRFYLRADGRMAWGGGAVAQDAFLYREEGGILGLDNTGLRGYRNTPGGISYSTRVPTDVDDRFRFTAGGAVAWGNGTDVPDVTLQRVAVRMLDLSGGIQTTNPAAAPGATAYASFMTGDTFDRYRTLANGRLEWGSGTADRDVNLYRSAANILKTDDALEVGGTLQVGGKGIYVITDWVTLASVGTFQSGVSAGTPAPRVRKVMYYGRELWEMEGRVVFDNTYGGSTMYSFNGASSSPYAPTDEHNFSVCGGSGSTVGPQRGYWNGSGNMGIAPTFSAGGMTYLMMGSFRILNPKSVA